MVISVSWAYYIEIVALQLVKISRDEPNGPLCPWGRLSCEYFLSGSKINCEGLT